MKISGVDPSGDLSRLLFHIQSKDIPEKDQRQTGQVKQGQSGDAVAISSFTRGVRDLSDTITNLPDIREDRVQQVRDALQRDQQFGDIATSGEFYHQRYGLQLFFFILTSRPWRGHSFT